jgi:tRNA-2-methylthio-N6-dimethylallyladenosine synthase
MIDLVGNKVHDEARQGEAFAPFEEDIHPYHKKFYIESYGCQMNFSDSEIVASILQQQGLAPPAILRAADLILLNTCSYSRKSRADSS